MFDVAEETYMDETGEQLEISRSLFDAINEILAFNRPNKLEGIP